MSVLGNRVSRFFGRMEILARGAEPYARAAEAALERGDALDARAQAKSLLVRVPGSPLGLALWAEASEACGFPEEVVDALQQLAERAPWRQEIWLRLGIAGVAAGWSGARAALERAAVGREVPSVTRAALLALADLDIVDDEPGRARRWLERVPPLEQDPELALRRAECAMALAKWEEARHWVERAPQISEAAQEQLGGRFRLMRARAAHRWPDEAVGDSPINLALSAYLLATRGSAEFVAQLIAESRDAALIARAREIIGELDDLDEPRWKAAFAFAEGRRDDARAALIEAAGAGDHAAAASLAVHAVRWRDMVALEAVAQLSKTLLAPDVHLLLQAHRALANEDDATALRKIEEAWRLGGDAEGWAEAEVRRVIYGWFGDVPTEGPASPRPSSAHRSPTSSWDSILGELHRVARMHDRLDLVPALEALAIEQQRPLYVAILGEFNAGKSTFINALLSTDVAPTGIRPTTASLHWVAWAPDPFARVLVEGGPDRVVGHADLKRTLDGLHKDGEVVERVFIYAPVERLKRIEILDTPGFNAPDTSHAAEARRGIEEAHVAIWLLDATAPLKESERQVIEQVADAGVPLLVLVNKRDRLLPDDRAKVMSYIARSLDETGIVSLAPPLMMSAQQALKGRLGDEEALSESAWSEVEGLLAEHLVNVADGLRDRALRRKAARVAGSLADEALARTREDRERIAADQHRVDRQRRVIAIMRGEQNTLISEIHDHIGPALKQLTRDVTPVEDVAEDSRGDAELARYVISQTTERLAPAIAKALGTSMRSRIDDAELDESQLTVTLRAVTAGAAAAFAGRPPIHGPALTQALSVALAMCADAVEANLTRPVDRSRLSTSLRIRTLVDALGGPARAQTPADAQNVAAPTSK